MNFVNCEKCDVQICGCCPSGPGGWHKVEEGNGFMQILRTSPHGSAQYCTMLYCTVLYCAVQYSTVLCCTAQYCTELHRTAPYCPPLKSMCRMRAIICAVAAVSDSILCKFEPFVKFIRPVRHSPTLTHTAVHSTAVQYSNAA